MNQVVLVGHTRRPFRAGRVLDYQLVFHRRQNLSERHRMATDRRHWLNDVKEVIRSRHYTWLPRGLGGKSVEEAMTWLAADIMHVCQLAGVSVDDVLASARQKFEDEERAQFPARVPAIDIPLTLPATTSAPHVTAYETKDGYEAEIVRGVLHEAQIACRLEGQMPSGLNEPVTTKILVHVEDGESARAVIAKSSSLNST